MSSQIYCYNPKILVFTNNFLPVSLPVDQHLPEGVVLGTLGQLHQDVGLGLVVLVRKQMVVLGGKGHEDNLSLIQQTKSFLSTGTQNKYSCTFTAEPVVY